jgi:C4-dicarboxylate transporter
VGLQLKRVRNYPFLIHPLRKSNFLSLSPVAAVIIIVAGTAGVLPVEIVKR